MGVCVVVVMVRFDSAVPSETRVTFAGSTAAAGPVEETVTVSVTAPAKPLRLVAVIVDAPDVPALMEMEAGSACSVKLA